MSDTRRDWPAGLPTVDSTPMFVAPDPTGLLMRGRQARRRHALVAGVAAAVVAAAGVTLGLNAQADRADRLHVVTPAKHHVPGTTETHRVPRLPIVGPPDGASTDASAVEPAGPAGTGTGVGPVPAGSDAGGSGDTGATGAGDAPAVVAGGKTAPAPVTATPFRRRTVENPSAASCAYQPSSAPSGWCLDYIGPVSAPAGVPVDLSVQLCRISGLGRGTLHFRDAEEADIWMLGSSSKDTWQWAHGRTFAKTPHTLSVAAGTCLRWTTRWTTRADDGRLLPKGGYSLEVFTLSPDADLPNTFTATSIDFELT